MTYAGSLSSPHPQLISLIRTVEINQSGKSAFLLVLSIGIVPMEVSARRMVVCCTQKKVSETFRCGSAGDVSAASRNSALACIVGRYRIIRSGDTKIIRPQTTS